SFDVPPVIVDGRVMVPFRAIFEKMGYEFSWIPQDQAIMTCQPGAATWLWMQIGNNYAYFGDKSYYMDVPPQMVDGRTMIPLRFIAEFACCKVAFDANTNSVSITRGDRQISDFAVYRGYDPNTMEGISNLQGVLSKSTVNSRSPQVFARAIFSGALNNNLEFNWYYLDKGTKVPSYSDKQFVSQDKAFSVLKNEYYRVGDWYLELKENDRVIQEYYFSIVDDQQGYGSLPWIDGNYEGYMKDGKPDGYGQIHLNNGTDIYGYIRQDDLHIQHGIGAYFLGRPQIKDIPEYVKSSYIVGSIYYPDGSLFKGNIMPMEYTETMNQSAYKVFYQVDGEMIYPDKSKKTLKGYYKDCDLQYRLAEVIGPVHVQIASYTGINNNAGTTREGYDLYCDDSEMNDKNTHVVCTMMGRWVYKDGSSFVGTLTWWRVANWTWDCWDISGIFTNPDGSTKDLEGCYTEASFDWDNRFDNLLEQGSVQDLINAGKI
ncbi:MAG TPA: copper amine oxidase N-terminal domain-containing protein, partial [Syntrophomonadaceae bacterium]|nr:copper amine oxidase N-terminal domain-containing protein [Syntrophomonadaceae bacterium]